VGNGALLIGAS